MVYPQMNEVFTLEPVKVTYPVSAKEEGETESIGKRHSWKYFTS